MKDFVKKYGKDIDSQNGENGIIEEVLKRIDKSVGIAVEFGAPNETYCSNIHFLKNKGWVCHFFDIDPQSEKVEKRNITPDNVNELPRCNVLSIDVDGNDYEIWKAYKHKPDVVVIEINSSLNPEVDFVSSDKGTNFSAMNRLANDKGYFLLCHTGNCIYVDLKYKELFPEIYLIVTPEKFFNYSWLPKETTNQFSLRETSGFSYK